MGLWTAATLAAGAVALGAATLREPGSTAGPRPATVLDRTAGSTSAPRPDQPEGRRAEPAEQVEVEPPAPAVLTPSTGAAKPTTAPRPGVSDPTRPVPQQTGTAGPPVRYTDDDGDPDWVAATAALHRPAFDILWVGWGPASHVVEQRRGYATSITVEGAARHDGVYVSYGEFYSDVPGETCQLYHVLAPGITAYANAFCGTIEAGTRRLVGQLEGSGVISRRTAAGGTTLVATFDDTALPAFVEAGDRMLWELSAFTCAEEPEGLLSGCYDYVDHAASRVDYRL